MDPRSAAARTVALYPRNGHCNSPASAVAARNSVRTPANDVPPEASWNSAILAKICAYALHVPALHDRAAQASGPLNSSSLANLHQRDQIQRKEQSHSSTVSIWFAPRALVVARLKYLVPLPPPLRCSASMGTLEMPLFGWQCGRHRNTSPAIRRGLGLNGDSFSYSGLPAQNPTNVREVHVLLMKVTTHGTPGFLLRTIWRVSFRLLACPCYIPCHVCRVRFAEHLLDAVCHHMITGGGGGGGG